ncbi:MAG: type II CAAX prenyl endopeptidase Rce1 family protein [Chloroflexota bacterium]
MLFTVKRRVASSLLLALLLVAVSLGVARWLDLSWSLALPERAALLVLLGLAAVALSDVLLHGLLWLMWRGAYLRRYGRLVGYFSQQSAAAVLAGGLLAACEELFFRGVLLSGIIERLEWGAVAGLVISSTAFLLLHLVLRADLGIFGLWAFWESILLGLVYLLSGSLLVSLLVHAAHDVIGFGLFALQRRSGWLLPQGYELPEHGVERR